MNITQFESKVIKLLTQKGMTGKKNIGLKDFCDYFTAFAWLAHTKGGDGDAMLDVLMDDSKLVGGDVFNQNFSLKFEQLYPKALEHNKAWKILMPSIVGFKGKGKGVGEMYLALVVQGWTIDRVDGKGDGKVAGGIRELKKNGASLKPVAKAIRIQDDLNRTVFEGHRAGPVTKFSDHREWILTKKDGVAVYKEYFGKLYPGRDVNKLAEDLYQANTGAEFNNIIGRQVLEWYKDVDHWDSLIIVDQDKETIANIANVNNLSHLPNLKFEWKSERGGDTQALTDGYVNIKI